MQTLTHITISEMCDMMSYPCVICDDECLTDAIQCSQCEHWVHSVCVPVTAELLQRWADSNMKFLCKECCFTDGQFDQKKSLQRLESVIDKSPRDRRTVTRCEALLLETYGQKVTISTDVGEQPVDEVSVEILLNYHPAVLKDVYPGETIGDGNCLYRAVSRALTGNESIYVLLRLLTLLEILTYPLYYDFQHKKFVDLLQDNRIMVAPYLQLAKEVAQLGTYADMMHMYALSAVLKLPIRSYYPPQFNAEFVSEPYSRKVCGRGVNISGVPACTIMWSAASSEFLRSSLEFNSNHFVPLLKRNTQTPEVVHVIIDDDTTNGCDITLCDDNVSRVTEEVSIDEPADGENALTEESADEPEVRATDNETTECHPLSNGSLDSAFMDAEDVIKVLTSYTYEESHSRIPDGVKNDVFFVVRNDNTVNIRGKGARPCFSDDCGVWDSSKGATPTSYYLANPEDSTFKIIYKKGEQLCYAKKVKGKKTFIPFEPQPSSENIIEMVRTYSTSKKDSSYKRRVTRLGTGRKHNIAVVEYIGTFPGLVPHGNAKEDNEYLRTPASVMSEMSDLLERENPLNVYNKLTIKHDVLEGPRNRKQVYDKKYNDKKKKCIEENGTYISRGNIADHINELDKMLTDKNSMVKSIIRDNGKAPCIILYTDDQIDDLKTLCCSGQSILGIDKTFNLCEMHVTASCYKNTSVYMDSTGEPPIFLGPVFIHDNSDFNSYSNFFNHLRVKLNGTDTSNLVIGSDEEHALVSSIKTSFSDAGHIHCMRHLRLNMKHKLSDECLDKADREKILEDIFGEDGLMGADDSICFDVRSEAIEEKCKAVSTKCHKYVEKKLKNNIKEQWRADIPSGYFDKNWTNNNCESLNHVLKRAINWQSKPLLDLVNTLTEIISTQFKDLKRSLVSMGQYRATSTHRQFVISKTLWASKTFEEKERLWRRFKNFIPKEKKTITSTDGKITVIKPRSNGRKIGQRKRKITERTSSYKKMKTYEFDPE